MINNSIISAIVRNRLSTNHEYFIRVMKQSVYRALGKRIIVSRDTAKWQAEVDAPFTSVEIARACAQPF